MFQQNLKALPGIVIACLGGLIGIAGATYGYHVGEKCSSPAKPVVQHGPDVVLYVDYVVEFRL